MAVLNPVADDLELAREHPRPAWRGVAIEAGVAWLISRVVLVVVSFYTALFHTPLSIEANGYSYQVSDPVTYLQTWQRWDSIWYLDIAHRGYFSAQSTAFFPLFPILSNGVTHLLGGNHYLVSGMIVANLAALAAFWAVATQAADHGGPAAVRRTLRVLVAFPTAFFLFAPYTEGLFIALATGSLLAARRGRWGLAALAAFGAGLTRPTALALVLPLVYEYGRQHEWWALRSWREALRRGLGEVVMGLAVAAAVPLAFLCYGAYLGFRFGKPLLFLTVQDIYWHRQLEPPWVIASSLVTHFANTPLFSYQLGAQLLDLGVVALVVTTIVLGWRRLPRALSLYSVGIVLLIVSAPEKDQVDTLVSAIRLVLVATPAFLVMAAWMKRRPWLDTLLVGGGFAVQASLLTFYLGGGWVA